MKVVTCPLRSVNFVRLPVSHRFGSSWNVPVICPAHKPVHGVVGVIRDTATRICHAKKVAVRIVGKCRHSTQGIGHLGQAIVGASDA